MLRSSSTEMFAWFAWRGNLQWRRYEIVSGAFQLLRRGMQGMVRSMLEESESSYEATHLRDLSLDWLSTPIDFSDIRREAFDFLGSEAEISGKWGNDVTRAWKDVEAALPLLAAVKNPIRAEIERLVREATVQGKRIRIFCRRAAASSFRTLPDVARLEEYDSDCFIHTLAEYRRRDPFDELIRIGPAWSRSFFAVPPAILNAPLYTTFHQLVWSGLADDPDCAVDPLLAAVRDATDDAAVQASVPLVRSGTSGVSITGVTVIGDAPSDVHGNVVPDEAEVWRQAPSSRVNNPTSVVLDLGPSGAVAYRPQTTLTVLRDIAGALTLESCEAEDIDDGRLFLVLHDVGDVDFGGAHASDGQFGRLWKERLRLRYAQDSNGLLMQLRDAGVQLGTLRNCIQHWVAPATSVVRAPKERRHFEILIQVLGIEDDAKGFPRGARVSWARQAWQEIQRSRGEAVRFGVEGERIVMAEAKAVLAEMVPAIERQLRVRDSVRVDIPAGKSLDGGFVVLRILAIECGFRVPITSLALCLTSLQELERWRA